MRLTTEGEVIIDLVRRWLDVDLRPQVDKQTWNDVFVRNPLLRDEE